MWVRCIANERKNYLRAYMQVLVNKVLTYGKAAELCLANS